MPFTQRILIQYTENKIHFKIRKHGRVDKLISGGKVFV